MSALNHWVRQAHRWTSVVFTVSVVANFLALAQGGGMPPPWITYSPLLPLALLVLSGCTCLCCRTRRGGATCAIPVPNHNPRVSTDQVWRAHQARDAAGKS